MSCVYKSYIDATFDREIVRQQCRIKVDKITNRWNWLSKSILDIPCQMQPYPKDRKYSQIRIKYTVIDLHLHSYAPQHNYTLFIKIIGNIFPLTLTKLSILRTYIKGLVIMSVTANGCIYICLYSAIVITISAIITLQPLGPR